MAFQWRSYFDLALELSQRTEEEAALRSAISRAYYAVYCTARDSLSERPLGTAHRPVWEAFRSSGNRDRRRVGNKGSALQRTREQADYESSVPDIQRTARKALTDAEELLRLLASL